MYELMNTNEIRMTSLEVVDLINKFRTEEGRNPKEHYTFMRDIRKELNTLKQLGLEGEYNFVLSSYTTSQGKDVSCYLMNRDGILMMLNKESTLVRYKTIEYINALENKLKEQHIRKQDSYMIENPVERAKRWIEEEQVRQQLLIENTQLKNEIEELEEYKTFKNMLDNRNEKDIMLLGQFGQWLKSNTNIKTGQKLIFAYCKENGLVKYEYKENYATAYAVNNQWLKNVGEFVDTRLGTKLVNKIMITNKGCLYLGEKLFKEYLENTLNQ